jgi:hypothetical protein
MIKATTARAITQNSQKFFDEILGDISGLINHSATHGNSKAVFPKWNSLTAERQQMLIILLEEAGYSVVIRGGNLDISW